MTIRVSAAISAGVVAGILSTVVEVLLWAVFTEKLPGILFRDARLTAAMAMGTGSLTPPDAFDPWIMAVATLIHFTLSIVYGLAAAVLVGGRGTRAALAAGAVFGAALYGINLYVFTLIFPWFAQARGWITLAAHLAFGISAAAVYHALSPPTSRTASRR